jgi:concentrative nucleoside transporter, CNT family
MDFPMTFSLFGLQGLMGASLLLAMAWAFSADRRGISWRKVFQLGLTQVLLTICLLKVPASRGLFISLGRGVDALSEATSKGAQFVFGYLAGDSLPFALKDPQSPPFILLFQALPIIVVVSALSMLLFYWGVLPALVRLIGRGTQAVARIGGALGMGMAGEIFMGQVESALLIKPYLARLSPNELLSLMAAGMATASASVFALYTAWLQPQLGTEALMHVLTANLVNIPAALLICELLMPEHAPVTQGDFSGKKEFVSATHAIAEGTQEGWSIMWAIAAMLLVSVALIEVVNMSFGALTNFALGESWTIQKAFSYLFAPMAWCMGVPFEQSLAGGQLLAEKTLINEMVTLVRVSKGEVGNVSARSLAILSYGLCGFANISSIGLQIIGIGGLEPQRKEETIRLAPRALIAAVLACTFSGAIVSLIL